MAMQLLNAEIASRLDEVANLLEQQHANPFRVNAYRHAARMLRWMVRPISEVVEQEGLPGLEKLEGIGPNLARSISQLVNSGRLPMLERLRGESDPVALLQSVPGIGRVTAERLYSDLGIHNLEELEAAAYDGRLTDIEGFGEKRIAAVRDSLTSRLRRIPGHGERAKGDWVSVDELLQVDEEYRHKAGAGLLTCITPRRFNPKKEAWLPVLHTERDSRHYTALFSNTALAHQLGKNRDWVILYFEDGKQENQCTVVTAHSGPLIGNRVVRGREEDCLRYYQNRNLAGLSA